MNDTSGWRGGMMERIGGMENIKDGEDCGNSLCCLIGGAPLAVRGTRVIQPGQLSRAPGVAPITAGGGGWRCDVMQCYGYHSPRQGIQRNKVISEYGLARYVVQLDEVVKIWSGSHAIGEGGSGRGCSVYLKCGSDRAPCLVGRSHHRGVASHYDLVGLSG
ncbi:hypothetical protein TIFTF001_032184 [Ficus carica]|uniref:Uncharacterized protein n=1 Tax=Ficus carica TaxID=3494 RepID=A0AA88DWI5_FICCA|nr:hypothetical protein TIFTF001_032184 [Ficus carica]